MVTEPPAREPKRSVWIFRGFTLLSAGLCLLLATAVFVGGFNNDAAAASCALVVLAPMVWLAAGVLGIWRARREMRRWWVMPLLLIGPASVALSFYLDSRHIPFNWAFRQSRPAMEQLVREVEALPPGAPLPAERQVGFFHATHIKRIRGGVRFSANYGHWLDDAGFAYSTEPLDEMARSADDPAYRRRQGNWFETFY